MFFQEVQHFRKQRILQFVLVIIGLAYLFQLYGFVQQIILDEPFGNNPSSDSEMIFSMIVSTLVLGGVIYLLGFGTLKTEVTSEGIVMDYPPFIRRRLYRWEDIESAEVRQYHPIREYGGWGWRLGLFGKGRAFNVAGNKGLQLVLRNGKRVLIGTQHPDDLRAALEQVPQAQN